MRIHDAMGGIQTASELFINAINERAAYSGKLPYVLSYAPIASMNPFQRLLYCRATEANFAVVPTLKFKDLGTVNWGDRSVIHFHWIASILRGATPQLAGSHIDEFRRDLINWKSRGHKILWTMHNVLPHNTQLLDAEIQLRKVIVEFSDAVHVLSKDSINESNRVFEIPREKIFHVPHPSYEGWYANVSDQATARLDLGISPGEFVFLQFGSIQRYKGTLNLIQSFKKLVVLRPNRRLRLVIAGKPVDKDYLSEVISQSQESLNITVIASAMEEREVQTLFNAASVVVAPYITTLNSGVALLAATFGKAIVAPKYAGLKETFIEDQTLLYSNDNGDSLIDALIRSLEYQMKKSVFKRILAEHKPERISRQFFDVVTKVLFTK